MFRQKQQQKELKLLNVRTQKWREMLKQSPFSNLSLVKKRIKKGVPPGMRQIVWPRLLQIQQFKYDSHQNYDLLTRQRSCIQHQIRLDIPRTYTQQKAQQMRISLFNVLKSLSLVYPQLGYCQGMNHLTMKLLETLTDESAFWIMNYLIRTQRNILWNYKNPSSTQLQNSVLTTLLSRHNPSLLKTLQTHQIDLLAITPKWFITLFSSTLPTELFYRIFQCFLIEGYKIVYKCVIVMLRMNERYLEENGFEEGLKRMMGAGQYEGVDVEGFCREMHGVEVSDEDVEMLEFKFINENSQKVIRWQEESQEYYQTRMKEQREKGSVNPEEEEERKKGKEFNLAKFEKIPFELFRFD